MNVRLGGSLPARRLFAVLAAAALAATACSSSSAEEGAAKSSDTTSPGAAGVDVSTSTTAPKTSAAPKAKSGQATTTSTPNIGDPIARNPNAPRASDVDPSTLTLEMTVTLEDSCVRPGDSQRITIHTLPAAGVAFDTEYADGKSGLMEGHHGGNFGGFTDPEGNWSYTWVIAATAPAGKALVLVLGSHDEGGMGEEYVWFTVADALGQCPE